jgi:hypothetical protein
LYYVRNPSEPRQTIIIPNDAKFIAMMPHVDHPEALLKIYVNYQDTHHHSVLSLNTPTRPLTQLFNVGYDTSKYSAYFKPDTDTSSTSEGYLLSNLKSNVDALGVLTLKAGPVVATTTTLTTDQTSSAPGPASISAQVSVPTPATPAPAPPTAQVPAGTIAILTFTDNSRIVVNASAANDVLEVQAPRGATLTAIAINTDVFPMAWLGTTTPNLQTTQGRKLGTTDVLALGKANEKWFIAIVPTSNYSRNVAHLVFSPGNDRDSSYLSQGITEIHKHVNPMYTGNATVKVPTKFRVFLQGVNTEAETELLNDISYDLTSGRRVSVRLKGNYNLSCDYASLSLTDNVLRGSCHGTGYRLDISSCSSVDWDRTAGGLKCGTLATAPGAMAAEVAGPARVAEASEPETDTTTRQDPVVVTQNALQISGNGQSMQIVDVLNLRTEITLTGTVTVKYKPDRVFLVYWKVISDSNKVWDISDFVHETPRFSTITPTPSHIESISLPENTRYIAMIPRVDHPDRVLEINYENSSDVNYNYYDNSVIDLEKWTSILYFPGSAYRVKFDDNKYTAQCMTDFGSKIPLYNNDRRTAGGAVKVEFRVIATVNRYNSGSPQDIRTVNQVVKVDGELSRSVNIDFDKNRFVAMGWNNTNGATPKFNDGNNRRFLSPKPDLYSLSHVAIVPKISDPSVIAYFNFEINSNLKSEVMTQGITMTDTPVMPMHFGPVTLIVNSGYRAFPCNANGSLFGTGMQGQGEYKLLTPSTDYPYFMILRFPYVTGPPPAVASTGAAVTTLVPAAPLVALPAAASVAAPVLTIKFTNGKEYKLTNSGTPFAPDEVGEATITFDDRKYYVYRTNAAGQAINNTPLLNNSEQSFGQYYLNHIIVWPKPQ